MTEQPSGLTPTRAARLRVLSSPDEAASGVTLQLGLDAEAVIGREAGCHLQIADSELSRRHLSVRLDIDAMVVTDLQSRNGTRLGRQRLVAERRVFGDAVVRIGRTVLLVGQVPDFASDSLSREDAWIGWLARQLAGDRGPAAIVGVPARTLAVSLAARCDAPGPVVVLESPRLDLPPFVTVVAECDSAEDARAYARAVAPIGGRFILATRALTEPIVRLVGEHRTTMVPSLRDRPQEVFRRTAAAFADADRPLRFRPTAWTRWLLANHTPETLGPRLDALLDESEQAPGGEVDTPAIRAVLGQRRPQAELPESASRAMARPDRGALLAALREGGSQTGAADLLGRNRRQIYRWMRAYGLRDPDLRDPDPAGDASPPE